MISCFCNGVVATILTQVIHGSEVRELLIHPKPFCARKTPQVAMKISGLLAVDELFSNVGLHFPIWVISCSSWWVPLFLELFVSAWVLSPQEFNTNFTVKVFSSKHWPWPKRLRKMIVLNRQGAWGNQSCLSRTRGGWNGFRFHPPDFFQNALLEMHPGGIFKFHA